MHKNDNSLFEPLFEFIVVCEKVLFNLSVIIFSTISCDVHSAGGDGCICFSQCCAVSVPPSGGAHVCSH